MFQQTPLINFPFSIELVLLTASVLLLLSIFASKISDRFGVPALLLFLALGMAAGSEGIGGIYFDEPWLAKFVGIVALIYILFAGGIETKYRDIKPVLKEGIILSTLGVYLTALCVACFAVYVLHWTMLEGMLLGAIISSTDAASVLNILRSKDIYLKSRLRSLLELESGSNDPMAVFLTLGAIRLIQEPGFSKFDFIPQFLMEVAIGTGMAWLMSRLFLFLVNNFKSSYEGLYPVMTLAYVPMIYAATAILKGNGFLAVYLAALMIGQREFLHKKNVVRFYEGIAWLMQIVMFLILGLLVFPSKMIPVVGIGCAVSLFLMFFARPLSVFVCLSFSKMDINEKLMLSWVGLRGAVPIVLATFPLLAGLPKADMIFNVVFFIVLTSIFFQGTTVALMSRLLKVDAPQTARKFFPIEFERQEGVDADLEEIVIPYQTDLAGKRLFEAGIPQDCLVVLVCREGKFLIPNGSTVIEGGDVLQVLGKPSAIRLLEKRLHASV